MTWFCFFGYPLRYQIMLQEFRARPAPISFSRLSQSFALRKITTPLRNFRIFGEYQNRTNDEPARRILVPTKSSQVIQLYFHSLYAFKCIFDFESSLWLPRNANEKQIHFCPRLYFHIHYIYTLWNWDFSFKKERQKTKWILENVKIHYRFSFLCFDPLLFWSGCYLLRKSIRL